MRALFLTPQLPYPPSKGTTLRNFNLIKNLAARHDIHLLSFEETDLLLGSPVGAVREPPLPASSLAAPSYPNDSGTPCKQTAAVDHLRSLCTSIHTVPAPPQRPTLRRLGSTIFSFLPDMALRLPSTEFRQMLEEILASERFDVVQVEGIEMARYVDTVLAHAHPTPAVVLDEHNAEYLLQRRAFETDLRSPAKWAGATYSLVQWQKLRSFERSACRKATAIAAVSEADRQALLALDPSLEVAVVSNGIDVEYFRESGVGKRETGVGMVFVGTMDYRPNVDAMVWFCKDILPLILKEMPEAGLRIVGRNPAKAVRKAASGKAEIMGEVDDVRPFIYNSAVYVVPMRIGGGVRFKVLEAMACGIPVVSTRVGAEGIDVADGEHLLLADEPPEFAAKVVRLLRDREMGKSLAKRARERVTALYDWRVIVPELEKLWQKHANNKSSL